MYSRVSGASIKSEVKVYCVGETTAVGEPKPGPLGRVAFAGVQRVGFVKAMVSMAAMGLGMGLMFGIVGKIF